MGRLIAVEGIDGAGKHTLVTSLIAQLQAQGARVETFAFPRYQKSVTADIAAEALHGEHGDLSASAYAMALMFALDRADAAADIAAAVRTNDVVICDRYVASNAAYSAARLGESTTGAAVDWVGRTEFERFGIPVPDRQVFLGVAPDVAARRAITRADADSSRVRDAYERDDELQRSVDRAYRELAAAQWYSPWTVLDGTETDVAARLGV